MCQHASNDGTNMNNDRNNNVNKSNNTGNNGRKTIVTDMFIKNFDKNLNF